MSTASILEPTTAAELADAVRSVPRAVIVGAGTKPRLSKVGGEFTPVSTARLRGIVDYEPSEFTFTALAGTPLREIVGELSSRGQYLPFDPLFVESRATIGGTVGAGVSGPGRFRFGGLRDFILGVRFVDGDGRLLRLGGKVVKNAAGFDVPKFFVGSAGRFGAFAELTFKVFPRPPSSRTLRFEAKDWAAKIKLLTDLANTRYEIEALDAAMEETAVFARIGGPEAALGPLTTEMLGRWVGTTLTSGDAEFFWRSVRECRWAHSGGALVKVALVPSQVADFVAAVRAWPEARGWISAGGNVGYFSLPSGRAVPALPWPALTLRGEAPLWPGVRPRFEIMRAVKTALDPRGRFPDLDD
jgi:glycolate oxidase FAD binding subunit